MSALLVPMSMGRVEFARSSKLNLLMGGFVGKGVESGNERMYGVSILTVVGHFSMRGIPNDARVPTGVQPDPVS